MKNGDAHTAIDVLLSTIALSYILVNSVYNPFINRSNSKTITNLVNGFSLRNLRNNDVNIDEIVAVVMKELDGILLEYVCIMQVNDDILFLISFVVDSLHSHEWFSEINSEFKMLWGF